MMVLHSHEYMHAWTNEFTVYSIHDFFYKDFQFEQQQTNHNQYFSISTISASLNKKCKKSELKIYNYQL
jgi:hypothetical protein